ncbi:AAA family ATPase [Lysinibacillus sp. NPDC048646]|uniref:AAA family ATPase n=1 Tax=Lysinibacillus sp. NPDC048646 TaxID=3390574 RepID=UPI003CFF049C
MLLKFSFENFKSFYDKQEISFEHEYNNANIFKNNTIFEYKDNKKKRAVLNGAVILGANAAGKSNIISAFSQMKAYFIDSVRFDKIDDFILRPKEFRFIEDNAKPIILAVEFMKKIEADYYKIIYQFSINQKNLFIENEKLSYQVVKKTTLSNEITVFERTRDSIIDNSPEISEIINKIKQENIKYKLVLSLLNFDINETFFKNEINTLPFKIVEVCGKSIYKDLILSNDSNNMDEFVEEIERNPKFKEYILENLYKYDFALSDFDIQDITDEFLESFNVVIEKMNNPERERFIKNVSKVKKYKVNTIHNVDKKSYDLPISDESAGTRKFLTHSLRIFESILMEKIYISDEFDSRYHIFIQEGIINSFIYPNIPNKTQFLLITHNPLLLNKDFFSKEQIYFVEKDRDSQSSYIFSLKDFGNVSYNNHNWVNLYLSGRIGAVPEVFD